MKSNNKKGFTIVELLIAISVFSALLIIIVYAFLYGLNTFSKAQVVSKTQEVSRSIEQNIAQSFSLTAAGSYTSITPVTNNANNGITSYGFCLGQYRYSYVLDKQLTSSNNYGLLQDTFQGCSSSTSPVDLSGSLPILNKPKQLLGNNMRISNFTITPSTPSNISATGYQLVVEIDYGNNLKAGTNGYKHQCPSGNISSSFCAVAKIDTIIFQRIQ
jgi:prepilin-type N-terminal cleavage/methylation domain-containing protein